MKKIIWGIALLFCTSLTANAQNGCKNSAQKSCCKRGYYTQYYGDKPELIKEAKAWAESGIWRNGFDKAKPHSSVNLVDFYLQSTSISNTIRIRSNGRRSSIILPRPIC